MAEIAQISGQNNQVRSAAGAKNGRAVGAPAQLISIGNAAAPRQMKLPVEDAVREVARGVTDYIVSNKLTLGQGYQAFRAELVSEIPLALLSISEMELIEKLSQALVGKVAMNPLNNPLNIATTEPGPVSLAQTGESLVAGNVSDTLEQILDRISQPLAGSSPLPEAGEAGEATEAEEAGAQRSGVAINGVLEPPIGLEQKVVMSWTLGSSAARDTGDSFTSAILSGNGSLGGLVDPNSSAAAENILTNSSEVVPVAQLSEGGQSPVSGAEGSSVMAPVIAGAPQQPDAGTPPVFSGRSGTPPDLLRMDLKEILGGKPAELRIRYDDVLIVSKVAVLLEQMNGLVRVYEEQNRGTSYSRQTPASDNRSLRQVLAAALGIVIDGSKTFSTPASVGVSRARDGLLLLDPTMLKGALESHRDETAAVLKSLANSFYENISLYVDPRILARFSELLGIGVADQADRSRKESERRWKKDKDLLEKRFLELNLILEESVKMRDWFMTAVEGLGSGLQDAEPTDEIAKRALPAVELPWDREEFLTVDRTEEQKEEVVTLFIAYSTRALQEEDAEKSIKILLKRKVLSDRFLAERPDLEPRAAMVCLANEELILERIETERKKLFKNLDELSRTMVAARGYRSQFPFPPPMAAFIASEG